jgi:tripartite-type tricarboxylate transporter receptor subunit TctC
MFIAPSHFVAFCLAIFTLAGIDGASAQYPTRQIRLIDGFAPGGPTDIVARITGQYLSERLGQQFVIENRPGAGGNLAVQAAVDASPDGYTLLVVAHNNAINASLYRSLPFNFLRDIVPVAGLVRIPNVAVVHPSVPAGSIAEFIAYARAHPGRINYGSAGSGTSSHLAAELLKSITGADIVHVPYRGAGPAMTDLLAGRIQLMLTSVASSAPQIKAGKLRALAVTTVARSEILPDVPTVAETVAGYEVSSWFGVGAPKNTPRAITGRLNSEISAALADPRMKARLAELGGTSMPFSEAEFRNFVADETEKWAKVVKAIGAKVD